MLLVALHAEDGEFTLKVLISILQSRKSLKDRKNMTMTTVRCNHRDICNVLYVWSPISQQHFWCQRSNRGTEEPLVPPPSRVSNLVQFAQEDLNLFSWACLCSVHLTSSKQEATQPSSKLSMPHAN